MRRRSPAAVQKWVDSIPTNNSNEQPDSVQPYHSSINNESIDNDNQEPPHHETHLDVDDSKNNNPPEPNKVSPSSSHASTSSRSNKHLSIFNKGKINELYQKLDVNKKRYNIFKAKSIEKLEKIKNMNLDHISSDNASSIDNVSNNTKISGEESGIFNAQKSQTNKKYEIFHFDENIDAAIASTSTPDNKNTSANLNKDPKTRQKMRLTEIGRSFSENRTTELEDGFTINERNNSCPNEIPDLDMIEKKIDNFNISSSIQNCDSSSERYNISDSGITPRSYSFSERKRNLFRDSSVQSDSSHCSSVESLLESRKPDPESILINLGFGPIETEDVLSKIPKR